MASTNPANVPDPNRPEPELDTAVLVDGYDWLATACRVVQALATALIAVTLIARL